MPHKKNQPANWQADFCVADGAVNDCLSALPANNHLPF
jgi:hypothetical protein